MLSELKRFKVHAILVLDYKKRSDRKIFHSSAKLIVNDSDTDEAFKSMHRSIMIKIEKICRWRLDCLGCNYKAQYEDFWMWILGEKMVITINFLCKLKLYFLENISNNC